MSIKTRYGYRSGWDKKMAKLFRKHCVKVDAGKLFTGEVVTGGFYSCRTIVWRPKKPLNGYTRRYRKKPKRTRYKR